MIWLYLIVFGWAAINCDEAIVNYIRKEHGLIIGEPTAERIKTQMGERDPRYTQGPNLQDAVDIEGHHPSDSQDPMADLKIDHQIEVRGRDAINGLPKAILLKAEDVFSCLLDPINQIIEVIKSTLDATPPELSADIVDRGVILTGGGSMLYGLPQIIEKETGVSVRIAEDPLHCVAKGTVKFLEMKLQHRRDLDE